MHIVKSPTIPKVRRETATTNKAFTAGPEARNTPSSSAEVGPSRPSAERLLRLNTPSSSAEAGPGRPSAERLLHLVRG